MFIVLSFVLCKLQLGLSLQTVKNNYLTWYSYLYGTDTY